MTLTKIYEDFLDSTQQDIIPQDNVSTEQEKTCSQEFYPMLIYMYLTGNERITQEDIEKIISKLSKVLDTYCDDYCRPEYCVTGPVRSIKFAIVPGRCTIVSVVRFLSALFNAGQLSKFRSSWVTAMEIFGGLNVKTWKDNEASISFPFMNEVSEAILGQNLTANQRGLTMRYVESREKNAERLSWFSSVLSRFFKSGKCPFEEYFKMISFNWKNKNIHRLIPSDSKEISIHKDISDGFNFAELDIDALVSNKISFYIENLPTSFSQYGYFGDHQYDSEALNFIIQNKACIDSVRIYDSMRQKEMSVVFFLKPLNFEDKYIGIKLYELCPYSQWETLAQIPSVIMKGSDAVEKSVRLWEDMFERWHRNAKKYGVLNESLLIKEDYLDDIKLVDAIEKEDNISVDDSIKDYPKIIYIECAAHKVDTKMLVKRMEAVLRSSALITEFSKPLILTNIDRPEILKDGIEYNPELLQTLMFRDGTLALCAGFSSRQDPSAKSVTKFIEDVFWKIMPTELMPSVIGVVDTYSPGYHRVIQREQMQKLGVAIRRDADVKIEYLRVFIRMTEMFNRGTFFLRDFLRYINCQTLLEQSMKLKVILQLLDISVKPWFDVRDIDTIDILSNAVITPDVLDAADKKLIQNATLDNSFLRVYDHSNNDSFYFLKKKLAGDITKATLTSIYANRPKKSIFIHYAIGTYYEPQNKEYYIFGCCFELDFSTNEKRADSKKKLMKILSGDKNLVIESLKRIEGIILR